MKNRIFIFAVTASMAAIFLSACDNTSEREAAEVRQKVKDTKSYYLAEWQKFKTGSEQIIISYEKRIEAFKEKLNNPGPKARAKYSKAVADLEQKNSDLKSRLDEYKDEEQGKRKEFKVSFTRDMDEIGMTMADLFKDDYE